jgi:hypothetical protein
MVVALLFGVGMGLYRRDYSRDTGWIEEWPPEPTLEEHLWSAFYVFLFFFTIAMCLGIAKALTEP